MEDLSTRIANLTPEKRALLEKRLKEKSDRKEPPAPEPLAVIGMSCRFPGGANGSAAFWQLLKNGVDAIREVPQDRWPVSAYYDPTPATPGRMNTRWGGFIDGVDQFDADFFGISPREAAQMDPQQRLLLEVAWEALEQAGQTLAALRGSATGVFIGIHSHSSEYAMMQLADPASAGTYTSTGTAHSVMANRISYWFDLRGPSLALDTACSSSLVAAHLACQSLRQHECRMALAGGVNLILAPEFTIALSQMNMMAADGRCKTFDASADGFVRGEGCGVVVLKRLSDALADGDPILALIRGSAVNQDGSTNGITAPNALSQQEVIRAALQNAGVAPQEISYVETHGTGTILGDPIEVEALTAVLGQPRPGQLPCVLGSVKANLGHLEGAAGIAGLIKTVLCLQHGEIPPQLHFKQLNPHITLSGTPFEIHPAGCAWPAAERRFAGVSSFGFGGTNAHLVLEAWRGQPEAENEKAADDAAVSQLLPLSARSPEALRQVVESYCRFLPGASCTPADLAYTAGVRRTHHEHRLAIVGRSLPEMAQKLAAFAAGEEDTGVLAARRKPGDRQPPLAFVFSGQGPNWFGVGRQLLAHEPVFRASMEACDALLRQLAGWSLLEELQRAEADSRLEEAEIAQPAFCAMQISLAALWQSWGIVPEAVIGHSVGEIAAAHVAGALTLAEAMTVVYHRGRLLQRETGRGKMAAVELSPEEMQKILAGYADRLALASINSPNAVVISGDAGALEEVAHLLQQREISCRQLTVKFASHSPQMEPCRFELTRLLQGLQPRPTMLPMISTVTGEAIAGDHLDAGYWGRNVRATVRFAEGIARLLQEDFRAFVEISPHPVIAGAITQCAQQQQKETVVVSSLRRGQDDRAMLLTALGTLYVHGYEVKWPALHPAGGRVVALPGYPWQHRRYWLEARRSSGRRQTVRGSDSRLPLAQPGHPLLAERVFAAVPIFEVPVGFTTLPFLEDHRVTDAGLVPAAVYLEMLRAAAAEIFGNRPHVITDMNIHAALAVPASGEVTLQLILTPQSAETHAFQIFSLAGEAERVAWQLHATGSLAPVTEATTAGTAPLVPADLQARLAATLSGDAFYERLGALGFQFGPRFRGVRQLWLGKEEALGRIEVPEALSSETGDYFIHPALLDAGLQMLAALLPDTGPHAEPVLMVNLGRFQMHRPPGTVLWSHARLQPESGHAAAVFHGDVHLYNETGELIASAENLLLKRLPRGLLQRETPAGKTEWLYEMSWQPAPPPPPVPAGETPAPVIAPAEILASLRPALRETAAQHGLAQFADLAPHLESLSLMYVLHAFHQLGWDCRAGEEFTAPALFEKLGIVPAQHPLAKRMLDMLVEDGLLTPAGGGRYQAAATITAIDPQWHLQELLKESPVCATELKLLGQCGDRLAEVLCGRCDPLTLLFPAAGEVSAEKLYRDSAFARTANVLAYQTLAAVVAQWPADRKIRVLEIGAGTGGTTAFVLEALPAERLEYVFTDVSPLFLSTAAEKFRNRTGLHYRLLDIEKDPVAQGFDGQQFDIILAANVLHATADLRRTLQHVKTLLASQGLLLLLEGTVQQRWIDLIFGMTEGWWRFRDHDLRPAHPLLSEFQWQEVLAQAGFEEPVALAEVDGLHKQALLLARGPRVQAQTNWLIFADSSGLGRQLAEYCAARNQAAHLVTAGATFEAPGGAGFRVNPANPADFQQLLRAAPAAQRRLVYLWGMNTPPLVATALEQAEAGQTMSTGGLLHLVQALAEEQPPAAAKLWVITAGAQPAGERSAGLAVQQAPLWGMSRVIALEHPEFWGGVIDVDPQADPAALVPKLWQEMAAASEEDQIAWRGEQRYVARLTRRQIAEPSRGAAGNGREGLPIRGDGSYLIPGGF
ncbi:MAG: acyltransferase domain-containing protein, partial [candidate division KSB1 bacterium]|nr:acyltransferase domain-containing protein [candidate division KSB1 bacterium]